MTNEQKQQIKEGFERNGKVYALGYRYERYGHDGKTYYDVTFTGCCEACEELLYERFHNLDDCLKYIEKEVGGDFNLVMLEQ